jgi:hypothetical protein
MASWLVLKTLLDVFGSSFCMFASFVDRGRFLGVLPFSGVTRMELLTKSMSVQQSWQASPHLTPVSFSSCRKVVILLLQAAISWSISVSVGMNGSFLIFL